MKRFIRGGIACLSLGVAAYALIAYALLPLGALLHPEMKASFLANALAFAAVTLRLYLPASMASGIPFEAAYPMIAWLCWLPNLAAVEAWPWWRRVPRAESAIREPGGRQLQV